LYCPWNSAAIQGACVAVFDKGKTNGYRLNVGLEPTKQIELTQLTEYDFKSNNRRIQQILGFRKCGICQDFTYVEKVSIEIALPKMCVKFIFVPTARCKTEYILSQFMETEIKFPLFINLTIGEKNVLFKVLLDYTASREVANLKLLNKNALNLCWPIITRVEMCPKVELLKHEVETVMKYHPRAEKLVWIQNKEDINGSTFVCCNNYILHQRSLGSLKYHPCSLISLLNILLFLTNGY
jgi:hypothetical protein